VGVETGGETWVLVSGCGASLLGMIGFSDTGTGGTTTVSVGVTGAVFGGRSVVAVKGCDEGALLGALAIGGGAAGVSRTGAGVANFGVSRRRAAALFWSGAISTLGAPAATGVGLSAAGGSAGTGGGAGGALSTAATGIGCAALLAWSWVGRVSR
jgi:hypothetical protein